MDDFEVDSRLTNAAAWLRRVSERRAWLEKDDSDDIAEEMMFLSATRHRRDDPWKDETNNGGGSTCGHRFSGRLPEANLDVSRHSRATQPRARTGVASRHRAVHSRSCTMTDGGEDSLTSPGLAAVTVVSRRRAAQSGGRESVR